jgi:sugar/nucleoside kinase (ribokinase family)
MGSSAVIFACGCARLGLKTAFIGKVGNDLFGQFMLDSMENRGIDVSGVISESTTGTGLSVILANQSDRAILTYPGVIPDLRYADIDFDVIKNCRHIHLSGYFLLEQLQDDVPRIFKESSELGLSISLDTNYDPSEKWNGSIEKTLDYVDVFLPNETEAKAIANASEIDSALTDLSNKAEQVIIKLGKEGAIGISRGQEVVLQKTINIEVVDTVGAGDSFNAGYIYGYLQGWSLSDSIRFAVACGTISTMDAGGTSGQATYEQAMDFVNSNLN